MFKLSDYIHRRWDCTEEDLTDYDIISYDIDTQNSIPDAHKIVAKKIQDMGGKWIASTTWAVPITTIMDKNIFDELRKQGISFTRAVIIYISESATLVCM